MNEIQNGKDLRLDTLRSTKKGKKENTNSNVLFAIVIVLVISLIASKIGIEIGANEKSIIELQGELTFEKWQEIGKENQDILTRLLNELGESNSTTATSFIAKTKATLPESLAENYKDKNGSENTINNLIYNSLKGVDIIYIYIVRPLAITTVGIGTAMYDVITFVTTTIVNVINIWN